MIQLEGSKRYTIFNRIKENLYFFISYAVLLLFFGLILIFTDKALSVIFFNEWRNGCFDDFFIFCSELENYGLLVLPILLLGLIRVKYLIQGKLAYIVAGLVTQVLKDFFDYPRPKVFFENSDLVIFVKDYHLSSWYSFPSGHSTSGFVLFLFLAIITKNKKIGLFYLWCAVFVAFSRVFLAQHFLIDVYFGSIIGVFFTILVVNFLDNNDKINSKSWYNYSLLQRIYSRLWMSN